jgi:3-deoxy-D-manno-octulosonate cytidylyltransferase
MKSIMKTQYTSLQQVTAHLLGVIPSRYASTRFPGKPLAKIHGLPMIQHVWQRARESFLTGALVVATDDERIQQTVLGFGGEALLTSPHHPSGTDRAWEVAQHYPQAELILNLQGDEPFMNPAHLNSLMQAVIDYPEADIWTLVCPLPTKSEATFLEAYHNPNLVKAVRGQNGQLLYCSRSPVPFCRDGGEQALWEQIKAQPQQTPILKHLGVYLYRREALALLSSLPPSPLESLEQLEQLRAMEAGLRLFAAIVDQAAIGVDTPQDLEQLTQSMKE